MARYNGEFPRKGEKIGTDSKDKAEQWLREMDSAGATVTDNHTGEVGRILYDGSVVWGDPDEHRKMITKHSDVNPSNNGNHGVPIRQQRHSTGTRTFVVLAVSKKTFDEIHTKLREAGYTHAFEGGLIDMHGIALEQDR